MAMPNTGREDKTEFSVASELCFNTQMDIISFSSPAEFRHWLEANQANTKGLWLRIYKKETDTPSVTYAEALEQALCYGWVDGQKKSYDETSWLQKFTPRGPRSGWSKINTQHVERLTEAGLMTTAGMKAVEAAQADGRWEAAYESQSKAAPPEDFLTALEQNPKAKAFFQTLNKANVYSIVYRLQTAKKPETREKRMRMILEMLDRGEKFH